MSLPECSSDSKAKGFALTVYRLSKDGARTDQNTWAAYAAHQQGGLDRVHAVDYYGGGGECFTNTSYWYIMLSWR
ncbi:MAG: hypothetical protein LBK75_04605 [Oscillospiraceae bacterium]|nr:hypothetical protein [Oscillospiraceae bacterium]